MPPPFFDRFSFSSRDPLQTALEKVNDPHTGQSYVLGKNIKRYRAQAGVVELEVVLGYPAQSQFAAIADTLQTALYSVPGVSEVRVTVSSQIIAHSLANGVPRCPAIKNVVAISSAKGGVGKSTVAANLALALAAEGAAVGILDADIYGPSQPLILGATQAQPVSPSKAVIEPVRRHGLQIMSIAFLVPGEQAVVWRGLMAVKALHQLFHQTRWEDLDYLLLDLPPGTGDIQLSLAQHFPVTGAVVVTTPDALALLDAKKGLRMFEKVHVPILGVIENMNVYVCSHCGHREPIFGTVGASSLCAEHAVPFLGSLPFDASPRSKVPTLLADAKGEQSKRYQHIARKMAAQLAKGKPDYAGRFPKIIVEQ